MNAEDGDAASPANQRKNAASIVRYHVAELMQGGREVILEHDGADYLLRITANGRLILTK